MNRLKMLAVSVASIALIGGAGTLSVQDAAAVCPVAQITAQQNVIAGLEAQKVGADARTVAMLNAQIAARQAAVDAMIASC